MPGITIWFAVCKVTLRVALSMTFQRIYGLEKSKWVVQLVCTWFLTLRNCEVCGRGKYVNHLSSRDQDMYWNWNRSCAIDVFTVRPVAPNLDW
jgi:hypothetical protein